MLSIYSSKTPLERCVWSIKFILWETCYFRNSNNIQVFAWNCKSLIVKIFDGITLKLKAASPAKVIRKKKKCLSLFIDWTRTLILRPFAACPKSTQVKLRAWNIEHDELSLSRPMNVFKNYKKHFLKSFRPEQWQ